VTLQLDHLFIITNDAAAIADDCRSLGWVETAPNAHRGQGTANRRFNFQNFKFELLFVNDTNEAAHGAGRDLRILQRSQQPRTSPIGIVTRLAHSDSPSFPHWRYFPDYFHGKMSFAVGQNSNQLREPLCICMPKELTHLSKTAGNSPNPDWMLTSADIFVPVTDPSPCLRHFAEIENVRIHYGQAHQLTLTFNHGKLNESKQFSPQLPLMINF